MLKLENLQVTGFEPAIRGMRNPKNSWDRSDSLSLNASLCDEEESYTLARQCMGTAPIIKKNDAKLMKTLRDAGKDHRKFMRMIDIYVDITAPLYWWKEFDTYKVGTVANSCSTMHKIHSKEFTIDDFSHEHLIPNETGLPFDEASIVGDDGISSYAPRDILELWIIPSLNLCRHLYNETKNKSYWWQMIQLLPSSYNQKRTVKMNYEVLANMYHSRQFHKLDEWRDFCKWIETLPYSWLITGAEAKAYGE